jgi:LPXTG-motif cell wall-anchored protein
MSATRTDGVHKKRRMGGGVLIAAATVVALMVPFPATAAPTADGTETVTFETTDARSDNPLKGFLPFAPEPGQALTAADPAFPHSLEWFYLPVNAVVTAEDTYDWTAVDNYLSSIADRGHQSVLRFYLDYPTRPTGVPSYLLGPDGISDERRYDFFDNNGVSFSPDYDDPRVVDLIVDFIAALGDRYDGDPRIAYLTAGLIGFWGEHHTYPMNGVVEPSNPDGINWMPSEATQETVWSAWNAALDETWLQARYPSTAVANHGFGLHDDSFAYSTLPTADWHFLSLVEQAGMTDTWQQVPIGGELYPPLQTCIFSEPLNCPNAAAEIADGRDYDVEAATAASHATWIINHQAWATGYTGADRTRAVSAAASLGYDLAATEATLSNTGDGASVSLTITNRGVAPFYYNWPAEFVLLDDSGAVTARAAVNVDLPSILPGTSTTVSATIPFAGPDLAGSTVAFSVPNVMQGGAPLRLANVTQDQDAVGYLSLGNVPALAGAAPAAGPGDAAELPATGSDQAAPGLAALMLLLVGTALLVRRRRSTATA